MSSVSSLLPNTNTSQATGAPNFQQIQSDFQSLSTALQSGNLANAQQAYSALKSAAPELFQTSSPSSSDPLTSALTSIGSALQSGDITGAQTAMASLQQAAKGHHHHHHGTGSTTDSAASTTAQTEAEGSQATTSSSGSSSSFSALA